MTEPEQGLQLHPPVVQLDAVARSPPSLEADKTKAGLPVASTGAIPMSLPSILRNPQLKHLNGAPLRAPASSTSTSTSTSGRLGGAGARPARDLSKRKARRADNARLAGNPHVVRPTPADFRLQANPRSSTFPASAYLKTGSGSKSTSLPIPQYGSTRAAEPCYDASSASSGQFRMSLKDARKVLSDRINVDRERFGTPGDGPVERTVCKAEAEIKLWLDETVFVTPDVKQRGRGRVLVDEQYRVVAQPSEAVDGRDDDDDNIDDDIDAAQIVELQRTPNALVWSIPDPFLRLAVHCLARIHGCPSFSKDAGPSSTSTSTSTPAAGQQGRHTWILNPNPLARGSRRPRRRGTGADRDRRRSDSVSTAASSHVLGGPGVGPQATRAAQLAGGIETPPTTDLDSRDGGSVRAWNPDEDTDDAGFMSSSAASVDHLGGGGAAGHDAAIPEETGSELSGSEAEEAKLIERRVRRWARHSDVHAHRLATPVEGSENDDGEGDDHARDNGGGDDVGDVTVVPLSSRAGAAKQGPEVRDADEEWERIPVPRQDGLEHGRRRIALDGGVPHDEGDSDWAADHEDAADSFSESDADVASLAESVDALDVAQGAAR
ncbi:uncharacterized protein PSFLO_02023 [Pseudozyma flocculosa]|nr:uncharacterized protein PSFLO_02023 [Pseudozyma flocculosa]